MGTTLERGALLHKRYRIVEILGQGGGEHADSSRACFLDNAGQVSSRFDKVNFRHEIQGLHLMDHIYNFYGRRIVSSCAGIEDQLDPQASIIC